jgi:DNA-binding MarR family transcriptional regulator
MDPVMVAWRNLHIADAVVCEQVNTRLNSEIGCSLTEHDLMAQLFAAPGQRLRMSDLAARLRVTPGGLTRIADRLVGRGWVERDQSPDNRREVRLTLTGTGTKAHETARTAYSEVLRDTLTKHLDETEIDNLTTITAKLLDRLGQRIGERP